MIFHSFSRRVASAVFSVSVLIGGLTVVAPTAVASTGIGPEYSPASGPEVHDVFKNGPEVIIEPLNEVREGVGCENNPDWPDAITVEETTCKIHIQPSVDKTQHNLSDGNPGEWALKPIQTLNGAPIDDTRAKHQKAAYVHVYENKADKNNITLEVVSGAADFVWRVPGLDENTGATCAFPSQSKSFEGKYFKLVQSGNNCVFTVSGPRPMEAPNTVNNSDNQYAKSLESKVLLTVTFSDSSTKTIPINVKIRPIVDITGTLTDNIYKGSALDLPIGTFYHQEAIDTCSSNNVEWSDKVYNNPPWIKAKWDGKKCQVTATPGPDVPAGTYDFYLNIIGKNGQKLPLHDQVTIPYEFEVGRIGRNSQNFVEIKITESGVKSCELNNNKTNPEWVSVSMKDGKCRLVIDENLLTPKNSSDDIFVNLIFKENRKRENHPIINFLHKVRIVVGVNVDAPTDNGVFSNPANLTFAFAGPEQPFATRDKVSFTSAPQGALKEFDGAAATEEKNLTELAQFDNADGSGYLTLPYVESVFLAWKNVNVPNTDHYVSIDKGNTWELVDPKNKDRSFMKLPARDDEGNARYIRKILQEWRVLPHTDIDTDSGNDDSAVKKFKAVFDVRKTHNRIPVPRKMTRNATCKEADGVPAGVTVNSDCSLTVDGTKFSVGDGVVSVPIIAQVNGGSERKILGLLTPIDGHDGGQKNPAAVVSFVIGMGGLLAVSIGIFAMLAKHCPFFRAFIAPGSGQ